MRHRIDIRAIRTLISSRLLNFRRKVSEPIDQDDSVSGRLVLTDDPIKDRIEIFFCDGGPSSRSSRP